MIWFLVIVGIIVLSLIFFLSTIWKEQEEEEKMIETASSGDVSKLKSSSLSKDNFSSQLNGIKIKNEKALLLKNGLNESIVGMENLINGILVALLCQGHILVEGVPGLAKTKTIQALSKLINLSFSRIQFTPDLLPSDITGFEIYDKVSGDFKFMNGPVFANILLADEINRTTPKVQSALLEAMQEKQVSIGNQTFDLPKPFFVMATQNPIEQSGTYSLPEAQLDRFLFKINVDYPTLEEELEILNKFDDSTSDLETIFKLEDLESMQAEVKKVIVSTHLNDYIVRLTQATRNAGFNFGSGPRGSIGLYKASQAIAYVQGRDYVEFDDVQRTALLVLRHRVGSNELGATAQSVVDEKLMTVFANVTLQ